MTSKPEDFFQAKQNYDLRRRVVILQFGTEKLNLGRNGTEHKNP